jgi:cytoskeletal protein RodZ
MQSVGTRLREARIKKGYTLEDVNARTRISLKNLDAIESDDLAKISSPFTYRSFVRQVADLVGLDHAALATDAQAASTTMPEPLVPGQEEVCVRPNQYQPVKPKPSWNWLRMASIAGVAGLVSVYLIWRNGGIAGAKLTSNPLPATSRVVVPAEESAIGVPQSAPSSPPRQKQEQPQAVVAAPPTVLVATKAEPPASALTQPSASPATEQLLPPSEISESSQQAPPAAARLLPSPLEPETGTIHIELSAIKPTWLSISADGKTTYRGILGAMETMSFDGKETAQIRTANAGGVNIIFNGRALGPLGRPGQSRTFVFTKSGYEVVRGVGSSAHTGG